MERSVLDIHLHKSAPITLWLPKDVGGRFTPEVEAEWVELACNSTSRELERVVAAHSPGERPSKEAVRESGPGRMCFEMEPAEAEQVRALLASLRAAAGVSREEVSDGALLAQASTRLMQDLENTEAPTGERFRMVIEHCPSCSRTVAAEAEVSMTHVDQACCDSEILEMREVSCCMMGCSAWSGRRADWCSGLGMTGLCG